MKLLKRYSLYLLRWQLSTPILAIVLKILSKMSTLSATIIANFIGGLIFFWVDKLIFKKKSDVPLWEIKNEAKCYFRSFSNAVGNYIKRTKFFF